MREKRRRQRSLFEAKSVDHVIGRELTAMSAWLDQQPQLLELIAKDVSPKGLAQRGRAGLSLETVLRCAVLKQYRQVGYRELEFLLQDSHSFQHFARVDPLAVPCKSALQANIGAIRAATFEALNDCLLAAARRHRIESGQTVRFDATVTASHILEPADSRLLFDGVRVLVRLLRAAHDALGAVIVFHNRRRVAKRRMRAIQSARKADRRVQLYRELVAVVQAMLSEVTAARGVVAHCPAVWAIAWCVETAHYQGLIERVIAQTKRRVFDGESVPACDKLVSLFEPHTDIINKGGRQIQYGHKVTLSSGKSALVLDAVIEVGNPPDTTRFVPMLERHITRYGRAPESVATDGGYAAQANLALAKQLGIKNVVFHKKCGIEIEAMTSKRWLYYKLKCFRAGIEAGISYLKRCFGLSRCNWKGLAHFKAYVWSAIFAHNLLVFGRLRSASG
jgi:transposase, IS5 family